MANQNNQINLFKILSSIYAEYVSTQDEEQKLYKKMNEEIAASEKKIKLFYQDKINLSKNNCNALKQKLENYRELLDKYSTFDSKLIGTIIEKLVTLVEGEEYSLQEAIHETYKRVSTPFGGEAFETTKKVLMIVKSKEKHAYYHDYNEQNDEINRLVRNGQAFILAENDYCFNKNITFYSTYKGKIKSLIDFNKFSYIKDFIDLVVEYRFNNNLDTISKKELLNLMSEFILIKKEIIEDNYKKRVLENLEELNQKLIKEQLRQNEEMERLKLEFLLQNGVPSQHEENLIDRLNKDANDNKDFNNAISQFEISYEGDKHIARITYDEPIISSENIFISKIKFESSIKDYFDDSDPDPHFHGFYDIDLMDDGLIGIVDISNLKQDLDNITNISNQYSHLYKVDKINDKYLRVLYLPNNGIYSHKSINIYSWIIGIVDDKQDKNNNSYITEWNCSLETEKMLAYLKEIELLSNLDEKQLKLYKQIKN